MNIDFNDVTYEKLKFLATREGRSVAAYVSNKMDDLTGQLVNATYSLNDLPEGVQLAHMDPTPNPRPAFIVLPSDSDNSRRYAHEQY